MKFYCVILTLVIIESACKFTDDKLNDFPSTNMNSGYNRWFPVERPIGRKRRVIRDAHVLYHQTEKPGKTKKRDLLYAHVTQMPYGKRKKRDLSDVYNKVNQFIQLLYAHPAMRPYGKRMKRDLRDVYVLH